VCCLTSQSTNSPLALSTYTRTVCVIGSIIYSWPAECREHDCNSSAYSFVDCLCVFSSYFSVNRKTSVKWCQISMANDSIASGKNYLKIKKISYRERPSLMTVLWEFGFTVLHLTLLVLQTHNSGAGTVCFSNCFFLLTHYQKLAQIRIKSFSILIRLGAGGVRDCCLFLCRGQNTRVG
jgi:hypothetical protein